MYKMQTTGNSTSDELHWIHCYMTAGKAKSIRLEVPFKVTRPQLISDRTFRRCYYEDKCQISFKNKIIIDNYTVQYTGFLLKQNCRHFF